MPESRPIRPSGKRHGFRVVGRYKYDHATHESLILSKPIGFSIRAAEETDLDAVLQLARSTAWNKDAYLHLQLARRCIDVACDPSGEVVSFIAWNREFFSKPFVWLAVIAPERRGRGIGNLLFAHVERQCKRERLYSSTNRSNAGMRRLFENRGYIYAGEIEVDRGDPELIYYVDL